ncbi:MAG: phage portal protein [Chloroflexi bacterium]|nr:phage portal protein [Chloroflexota bacterium]
MAFWSNLLKVLADDAGITANTTESDPDSIGGNVYSPGDPEGVDLSSFADVGLEESRSLPSLQPSPWDGWPADWNLPNWHGSRFNELIDIAWACLDINASVLSTMPVIRQRAGTVLSPKTWMANPDPLIYTSWEEFAKQLFWDFMCGEAFVLVTEWTWDGAPLRFRVVPPMHMDVTVRGGTREYRLGGPSGRLLEPGEVLHVRYKSTTMGARGVGPLESAGGRMLTAGVLAKYTREIAETGGISVQTLETDQELEPEEADAVAERWIASRMKKLAVPPVLDRNLKLQDHRSVTPRDLAMLEISQFTEARIAVLLGVPPFLVALPNASGGGESLTYQNVGQLFTFHDRASLRTKAQHVMAALSYWLLPRGQKLELNRDEYTRPPFTERATAWVALVEAGIMTVEEVREAERLAGDPDQPGESDEDDGPSGALALVGGDE